MDRATKLFGMVIMLIIIVVAGFFNLVMTGIRQFSCSVFSQECYWDLKNEWFQLKLDIERWYYYGTKS